jgi:hypothetical protein
LEYLIWIPALAVLHLMVGGWGLLITLAAVTLIVLIVVRLEERGDAIDQIEACAPWRGRTARQIRDSVGEPDVIDPLGDGREVWRYATGGRVVHFHLNCDIITRWDVVALPR